MRQGRTWRKRKKQKTSDSAGSMCLKDVSLFTWAKINAMNFRRCPLKAFNFQNTGRGMMSTRTIEKDGIIISIPENILIYSSKIMTGYIGDIIKKNSVKGLSHIQVLCIFLICERYNELSIWRDYIRSLPTTYSTPAYWEIQLIGLLPDWIRTKALQQIEDIKESFKLASPLMTILQSVYPQYADCLCLEDYKWAWTTINTRGVYMKQESHPHLLCNRDQDNVALAPILDFLNHSCNVEVKAGFNEVTKTYDITTLQTYKKGEQVFICYGSHDNAKLLVEYGFVVPDNPQDNVLFDLDDLLHLASQMKTSQKDLKFNIIKDDPQLNKNMSCSLDGLSWNLQIALVILSIPVVKMHLWKQFKMGNNMDDEQTIQYKQYANCLLLRKFNMIPDVKFKEGDHYHKKLICDICSSQREILEYCIGTLT